MKVGSRVQCLVAELDFEAEVSTTESVRQVEIKQIGFTDLVVVDPDIVQNSVCVDIAILWRWRFWQKR
ncbi:hypothetical protein F0562_006045 [Nyssa sinensis]|uniref:Uncharacterized protein n=1 Tax=Nyssa sinensis TaxID=561372 RepID=A0A5J5ANQ9_9ASTE|nr:hypothetical protein F0562_006045 [Nyssa sinensis]